MKPLTKLNEALLPDGSKLELWERDNVYLLLEDGVQVASSFSYGSDEKMAELAASPLKRANQPTFLIAGLGLGFILQGLKDACTRDKAEFVVAEPVAELPEWHKTLLKDLHPGLIDDDRVKIERLTALAVARRSSKKFHGILIRSVQGRVYMKVAEASDYFASLREGGLLIISVARSDKRLERTLQNAGFQVTFETVPASHKGKQTSFHTLIIAKKGRFVPLAERVRR